MVDLKFWCDLDERDQINPGTARKSASLETRRWDEDHGSLNVHLSNFSFEYIVFIHHLSVIFGKDQIGERSEDRISALGPLRWNEPRRFVAISLLSSPVLRSHVALGGQGRSIRIVPGVASTR